MFINEELLAVIFRLVNFGILIFLCVYAFKRHVLPVLCDQMRTQENKKKEVEDRHEQLFHQEKIVERFTKEQKVQCAYLQEKVRMWSDVHEQHMKKRDQEKERRIQQLYTRVQHQEKWLAQEHERSIIIPRAVHSAHDTLQQTFQSQKKQHEFVEQLMKAINQEMS